LGDDLRIFLKQMATKNSVQTRSNKCKGLKLTIQPHSPEWYDRLATLQDGYFYPWKSQIASNNGETDYLELVRQHLTRETDLLDVGCGHGEVALELAPDCHRILAYDRVERYIKLAKEQARKADVRNLTYLCVDSSLAANEGVAKIPANSNSFDLLISRRGPLHWLEDARRVARPGAVLIQLNPLETPLPVWADSLPEPLCSATGIEYQYGMLNSVKYRLKVGNLELHSAWTFDVPEYFSEPKELYNRLAWGFVPGEVPTWNEVASIFKSIYEQFAEPEGLALRHTRLLWKSVVEK
jgi:SAM-dependent methyltransferase